MRHSNQKKTVTFTDKCIVYRYGFFDPEFNLDAQNKARLKQWIRKEVFLEKEIARLFGAKANAESASILMTKHTRLELEVSIERYLHAVAKQYEEVIELLSDKAVSDNDFEVLIPLASKIDTYKAAYESMEAISFETLAEMSNISEVIIVECKALKKQVQEKTTLNLKNWIAKENKVQYDFKDLMGLPLNMRLLPEATLSALRELLSRVENEEKSNSIWVLINKYAHEIIEQLLEAYKQTFNNAFFPLLQELETKLHIERENFTEVFENLKHQVVVLNHRACIDNKELERFIELHSEVVGKLSKIQEKIINILLAQTKHF